LASIIKNTIIGKITILEQKHFYKSVDKQEGTTKEERLKWVYENYNFDCPDAIDWELFKKTLNALIEGNSYKVPVFDEETKKR